MYPPRYNHLPNKVCRLKKALYRLKQAPQAWYSKFSDTHEKLGFLSSSYDSTLFIKKSSLGIVVLLVYVDDMVIISDDKLGIQILKVFLSTQFEMNDLGIVSYFLSQVLYGLFSIPN